MEETGWLVQILLPLYDKDRQRFGEEVFARTRAELTARFGGLTAYQSAPARGLWQTDEGVERDDIVVFEVMAASLDRGWWTTYRGSLEARYRQDLIVIRAMRMETL